MAKHVLAYSSPLTEELQNCGQMWSYPEFLEDKRSENKWGNMNFRENSLFQKKIKQYTLGPGMKNTKVCAKNSKREFLYSYIMLELYQEGARDLEFSSPCNKSCIKMINAERAW